LAFVFQDELDKARNVWNRHVIRSSRRNLPSGKPVLMFEIPELYNADSHLQTVAQQDITNAAPLSLFRDAIPCDPDVYQLCCTVMRQHAMTYPRNCEEALAVYFLCRESIRQLLAI